MANEKLGVATEPSPESLLQGGFRFVQWGLTFWNLNKHHCFIVLHISIWVKPPPWGRDYMWQYFSVLFDATDLQKYLGYAICQACKICQTFCLQAWQGPKWHNAFRWCLFCFMRQKLWWDYFAFSWTQLGEVVIWQVQYAETIGWGPRVYG